MKTLNRTLLLVALGASIQWTTYLAAARPDRRPEAPDHPPGDTQGAPHRRPMGEAVAGMYTSVFAYDVNRDGKIDETEQHALAEAIADGKVKLPPRRNHPPGGEGPDPSRMAKRISGRYAEIAPFDVNHDGKLDESELEQVKKAVDDGKLQPPHRPGGRGPRGPQDADSGEDHPPRHEGGRPPRGGRRPVGPDQGPDDGQPREPRP